ncbi:mannos-6-phosphate isomerase [Coprinellus micaceus]|uniref:Mannose-6-phosphate isomerase n=1 Tax=Coprinellus micaceus TaxID=71717 RepID=A0A4Y7SKU1_COPMI|nr:mannos-6-phosphate isomerase [Coprinellus micaceus]
MTSKSSTSALKVFKIVPTTQQYDWGKIGREAKVAQFAEASKLPGFTVDEVKPYAELWMGTHSSSPSLVKDTGDLLSDHLRKYPDLIGPRIAEKFPDAKNGELPFLFKVLSIAKALSIQSHPDKETAKHLHGVSPKIYKDPNHKPEMALALTEFEALCGFRPLNDIAANLRATPELESLIPSTMLQAFYAAASSSSDSSPSPEQKAALKNLFSALMTAPPSQVHSAIESLVTRYSSSSPSSLADATLHPLILKLQSQFPYDVGVLCPFLLNIIHLSPGSAIFLGAGEPHAYISGEAIECMANSDNVIRAGLTPKLRDVENLVKGLTYECGGGERSYVQPKAFTEESSNGSLLYDPPIEEFSVVKVDLPKGASELQRAVDGPSVVIITHGSGRIAWVQEGKGEELETGTGDVLFIGAGTPVSFSTRGKEDGLGAFRAFVEA